MSRKTHFRVLPGDAWVRGVRHTEDGCHFSVAIPDGAEAELLLYTDAGKSQPCQIIPLPEEDRIGEVSAVTIQMPHDGTWAYAYRINGRICPDRYAGNIRGRLCHETGRTELHALTASPEVAVTKPLKIPYEDSVIYKAHVRGLTKRKPQGVRHPGTFLGITEYIPYLKEMGVNMLMLMPCYEFREMPDTVSEYPLDGDLKVYSSDPDMIRKNYWGYTEGFYFAPKTAYSAGEDPCREFAEMVDALHREGIGCIPEFWFDAAEDSRFVTDVLRHWLMHYQADGFHLVGEGSWIHAVASDPLLKKTRILYSRFDETAADARKSRNHEKTLGVYNPGYEQVMRRFLKGDQDISTDEVAWLLRRNDAVFGMVNYFADQDGFTMADMVSYEEKHNEANGQQNRDGCHANFSWNCGEEGPSRKQAVRRRREQQLKNAWLMLMTSQGTPMIYAGDEVMNSQNGNNNAWCQDNETGWVTWKRTEEVSRMKEFVRKAVAFRMAHPVLRQPMPLRMADYRASGTPDISYHSQIAWMSMSGQTKSGLGVMYSGAYGKKQDGTSDDTLYIIYNMYWMPQNFALPDLPAGSCWMVTADTSRKDSFPEKPVLPAAGEEGAKQLQVPPRTVMILTAVSTESVLQNRNAAGNTVPEKESAEKAAAETKTAVSAAAETKAAESAASEMKADESDAAEPETAENAVPEKGN